MQQSRVKKLKRVSYTIPSFAARASSNTTCDPIVLGGPPTFCCPHGPPDGVHIVDLVLESTNLQGVFFSQCLQNAWAPLSDWPRSYYQNAFWETFGFYFTTSHRLAALLTSLPGPGRCPAHQPDHRKSWPPKQSDWRSGSQGLAAAAGRTPQMKVGVLTSLQQPERLMVADSLGISFGLGKSPVQQSSPLTGSCCRHGSQQDRHICCFGWW